MRTVRVEIVPWDPVWIEIFEKEKILLESVLEGNILAIHHVGSTAVPGLDAKPKIDMIAVVRHWRFDHHILESLGYEYRGGLNIPLRKTFTLRAGARNINLHIFREFNPEIALNLCIRDHLRAHQEDREKYALLKHEIVAQESAHKIDAGMLRKYTLDKNVFIQSIIRKAGYQQYRIVECMHDAEWQAVEQLQKIFPSKHRVKKNTLQKPYMCMVLYHGADIVGYALLYVEPGSARIEEMIIEESLRTLTARENFSRFLKEWLECIDVIVR